MDSARRLFNRHGFERVTIDQIMENAGLTRGGFYSYFNSKSALYTEVLGCFFTDPDWKNCWDGVDVDLASGDVGPQIVRAYLSRQHFDDVENSCPMVALPTDVARADPKARRAFEIVFAAMVNVLDRSLRARGRNRRATAQAIAALCVGGMVMARAFEARASADALRDACMQTALELGGWNEHKPATTIRKVSPAGERKRPSRTHAAKPLR
ncbi:MAG TPA: helix-turn-helix domain-containing protein [Terracidiphilus sp.]